MKYCRLSSLAMPAVAGSRSRAETMISVRPPLSSVIDRSASALKRSLLMCGPGDGRPLDGDVALTGVCTTGAPGNAAGIGTDFGADGAGALETLEYEDVDEPDASM